MKTTNKNARSFVEKREPFRGSNLFAEYHNDIYVVYSWGYHWPLLACVRGVWYRNIDRTSVSTSRQLSQVTPHTHNYIDTSLINIKRIINRGSIDIRNVRAYWCGYQTVLQIKGKVTKSAVKKELDLYLGIPIKQPFTYEVLK